DDVHREWLAELAGAGQRTIAHPHLDLLARQRRGRAARADADVRDRRGSHVRRAGDRLALTIRRAGGAGARQTMLRRRPRAQGCRREVGHRPGSELLDPLLGEEHRGRLAAARGDAARRVLEAGGDRHQADRQEGGGHEHFGQREAAPPVDYCTLTRPEAATTTLRVPPFGLVTVNVPASSAAPAVVAELRQYDMNCGSPSAARSPIIATTTINSASENPACRSLTSAVR